MAPTASFGFLPHSVAIVTGGESGIGLEPLLMPPPAKDRTVTDIAFAASCLVEGCDIWLYYSLEDRILRRARIARYYPKP